MPWMKKLEQLATFVTNFSAIGYMEQGGIVLPPYHGRYWGQSKQ